MLVFSILGPSISLLIEGPDSHLLAIELSEEEKETETEKKFEKQFVFIDRSYHSSPNPIQLNDASSLRYFFSISNYTQEIHLPPPEVLL